MHRASMGRAMGVTSSETVGGSALSQCLAAIAEYAGLPPYVKPAAALRSTLHALFERLSQGQAHAVMTSLPSDVRQLVEPASLERHGMLAWQGGRAELFDRVGNDLGVAPASAELIASAVFRAVQQLLPSDVIGHVAQQLPHDLRDVWQAPVANATEDIAGDLDLLRQILDDIERSGVLSAGLTAREAFASVMCIFAQRLSGGDARDLLLGLPRTIRPFVERCMIERREEPTTFGFDELTANVAQELGTNLPDAEAIVESVFAAVTRALPQEEIDRVASQLPADLRRLWLA